MSQFFQPYKYFNGEKTNPYDAISQNAQFNFWSYESHFEAMFNMGDFSLEEWEHIDTSKGKGELKDILNRKPVDKEELFKLFMFHILMEHIPDKVQSPPTDKYLKMYHKLKE